MALSAPVIEAEDIEPRFRRELGDGWLATGADTAAHTVGGSPPRLLLAPPSIDDITRVVRLAEELGLGLIPTGNGTHRHVGQPPQRYDVALVTTGLAAIRRHDAADMTVTVEAGVTIEALGAVLARAGQWLPIDVPHPERVTVGGLIAADLNGSLRLSHGKVRDYVIGVRAVIGGGDLVRGGGQVVKNVAGYDLPKLMIGSHGTLGVIVEATFKVRPRPAADVTLAAAVASIEDAVARASAILHGPFEPFAVDVLDAGAAAAVGLAPRTHVVARFGGEAEEVCVQRDRLAALLPETSELDHRVVDALRDFQLDGPGAVGCRVSVLPSDVGLILHRVGAEAAEFGVAACVQAHAGCGVLRLRAGGEPAALVRFAHWLRFLAEQHRGFVVIEQAPSEVRAQLDVWGRAAGPLSIMQGIKRALDPHAVFSPGRFVGGI